MNEPLEQPEVFDLIPQRNQTEQHWWLCQAARRYLLWAGAHYAAMEVSMWEDRPIFPGEPELAGYTTQVGTRVDVLAVMRLYDALSRSQMPRLTDEGNSLVTVAAEVKVSRADFRRGFDDNLADFNYVACPSGLLKPCELPPHVGLLVYDGGVSMRRRAKRIEEPRFTVNDAVWSIASACAREVRRMRPTIQNPFKVVSDDE